MKENPDRSEPGPKGESKTEMLARALAQRDAVIAQPKSAQRDGMLQALTEVINDLEKEVNEEKKPSFDAYDMSGSERANLLNRIDKHQDTGRAW